MFRTRVDLEEAVFRLDGAYVAQQHLVQRTPSDGASWRFFNLITVARLMARAALRREESRGAHFRADFPARDDRNWRFHAVDARLAD